LREKEQPLIAAGRVLLFVQSTMPRGGAPGFVRHSAAAANSRRPKASPDSRSADLSGRLVERANPDGRHSSA